MASADVLLRQLEQSPLFEDDFPRRPRFTHAEWAAASEEARFSSHAPGLAAIRRVKDVDALSSAVRQLGQARHAPAVPLLARLWAECALQPVRVAVGHALREIGNPDARAALESLIEDCDYISVFLAVRAVFDADPMAAFDRLAAYFHPARMRTPGGSAIPNEILATFGPSSFLIGRDGKEQPRWTEPRAPAWFLEDRRWLELCIRLRRDELLGSVARDALRHSDREIVGRTLDAARAKEGPRRVEARSHPAGDLVARYRRGDHEAVWRLLRQHEAIEGAFREEALAVARETMSRVARAADELAERLGAGGWRALSGSLRTPPQAADQEIMTRIEAVTGALLPPSLRAFWEVVGGIDFIWNYRDEREVASLGVDLAMEQMDPLALDAAGRAIDLFDDWEYHRRGVDPELADPFNLDLAPDHLHKADISGGPPYGIELPFPGADPILVNEEHLLPLVEYLRLCFRWGGFPRLERYAGEPGVRAFVATMTKGLEPF